MTTLKLCQLFLMFPLYKNEVRNNECCLYVGNLDNNVDEDILYELFVQTGPLKNVFIYRDRLTGQHQGFAFVEFRREEDALYALKVLSGIQLYNKPIRLNRAAQDKAHYEVGANLFVKNLPKTMDEAAVYNLFEVFGEITSVKVVVDVETFESKGQAYVCFNCFKASDAAIDKLDQKYIADNLISVSYALKPGSNEKHGSEAERFLAKYSENFY